MNWNSNTDTFKSPEIFVNSLEEHQFHKKWCLLHIIAHKHTHKHIVFMKNNIVELWLIRYDLPLSWNLVYKYLMLEVGSLIVMNWLTTRGVLVPNKFILACVCRNLLEIDHSSMSHSHAYREVNIYTNELAKSER